MGIEIERKYKVAKNAFLELNNFYPMLNYDAQNIVQGYIISKDASVRIRHISYNDRRKDEAFITIKSKSKGISRQEYEYSIPVEDALMMLKTICSVSVSKTRYAFTDKESGLIWEIDFFKDKNEGLVIAEVELEREDQEVVKPPYDIILEEVSGNKMLTNLALSMYPYSRWTDEEKQAL